MINFKAKYLHSSNILRRNNQKEFVNYKASFVEIDPRNIDDRLVVNKVNLNWDSGETLVSHITESINSIYNNKPLLKEKKFYALTKQQDCFEKLDASDILGLVEVSKLDDETQEIDYLQLNPRYLGNVREFIKMGNAIMKSIKTLYSNKILEVSSSASAINFYRRNGFLPLNSFGKMRFIP